MLAASLTPTIIGSHESNLSESDAVGAVNAYVSTYFGDVKPLIQKALLTKMTEAARKHLGLSELSRVPLSVVTTPPPKKPMRDRAGTPRPEEMLEGFPQQQNEAVSSNVPTLPTPKSSKKLAAVRTLDAAGSISEGDEEELSGAGGKSGATGGAGKSSATYPGTSGSWLDVDLSKEDCDVAYAEPLGKDVADNAEVVAMSHWMGPEAARAAYSHDWRARCGQLPGCVFMSLLLSLVCGTIAGNLC